MPHPPLYLVTPYKGVDIDKRERRHRTPKQNRQTMKINEILSPSIRQVLKPRKQQTPLWQQRQSADSDFCRAVVANGYMSEEQMQEAVSRYRLGCSRDGGVIFWQIDTLGHEYDGKIMYYRPDCHRDHQRHPQWVSNLLKRQFLGRFPEMAAWMPETHHCLFGTHLLREDVRGLRAEGLSQTSSFRLHTSAVAVVEAEKTAVIMSAHYPQYLWLAAGGLTELTAQKLFPLRHHRVVLFPDTDPDQTAYKRWYTIAQEARRLYGLDIRVSALLERHATAEQKQAKIDLVDYCLTAKR